MCTTLQYESTSPTTSTNRACSTCRVVSACAVGSYLSGTCSGANTPASNPTCAPCDGASGYQNEAGSVACKAVTVCSSTQYQTTGPSRTSNRVCASCRIASGCSAGSYLTGACSGSNTPPSNPTCALCDGAGGYQNEVCIYFI